MYARLSPSRLACTASNLKVRTAANFQRTTHVIIYKYRKKQFAVRHCRSCILISSIGPMLGQGLLKVPKLHLRRWSNKLRATCMLLCCLEHRRQFGRRRFLYEPLTTTRNHLLSRLQTMDLCAMFNRVHLYIYIRHNHNILHYYPQISDSFIYFLFTPLPTAITSPLSGFSAAESGIIIPEAVLISWAKIYTSQNLETSAKKKVLHRVLTITLSST